MRHARRDDPTVDETATHLLRLAQDGPHDVVVLTDADLLALDGIDAASVAEQPWLGDRDSRTRGLAAELGRRQLAARGLAAVAEDGRVDVGLAVVATLGMRRAASAIVLCRQETAYGATSLVAYGQGALGVLLESVDGFGLHRFLTATPTDALDALVAFAVPGQRFAEVESDVRRFDEASWFDTAAPGLADAHAVTVVSGTGRDGEATRERRMSVYARPATAAVATPDGDLLALRAITRSGLAGMFRAVAGLGPGDPPGLASSPRSRA